MILQKLASAIRRQDWFQVLVEVLIVIIGIFLGLQVTEWNEGREDRIREKTYLNRLHNEIIEGIDLELGFSNATTLDQRYFLLVDQLLDDVRSYFRDLYPLESLNKEHCFAIYSSHIYVDRSANLSSIKELISNGELSLIRNEEIKEAFSRYSLMENSIEKLLAGYSGIKIVLSTKYPNLIEVDPAMKNILDYENYSHKCSFAKMYNNISFKNDLLDNATRLNSYLRTKFAAEELLNNLHKELDKELGIIHD